MREKEINVKYDGHTFEQQEYMWLAHCVQAKIVGGGRALKLIQSEEGKRSVCVLVCYRTEMTFPPPTKRLVRRPHTQWRCKSWGSPFPLPLSFPSCSYCTPTFYFLLPFSSSPLLALLIQLLVLSSAPPLGSFVWRWNGRDVTVVFLWALNGLTQQEHRKHSYCRVWLCVLPPDKVFTWMELPNMRKKTLITSLIR